jgi:hypothetical protein
MVARNLFFDVDHGINLSQNTATIFEHNTVANIHEDFLYTLGAQTQTVKCSVVNFFVAEDGANPTYGDGAYLGFNLISSVPHMFSGPDSRKVGGVLVNDITTRIQFFHNLLDQILDPVIGPNHPGGFFSGTYGPNTAGIPGFVDPMAKDYSLRADSPARGSAPGGFDYGMTIPEWAYLAGGPSGSSFASNAAFEVGGPGLVAYKWRLDGGAWSAPVQIGSGGDFSRTGPTVRRAALAFIGLALGTHTIEVLGQDMAGNWQDADPARTLEGMAQAAPTSRTWIVQNAQADDDQDGIPALVEYALGLNASNPNGGNGRGGLPSTSINPGGRLELLLNIPQNATATQGHGMADTIYHIQASSDLIAWTTIATKRSSSSWTGPATVTVGTPVGSFVPVTIEDVAGGSQRFLRFQAVFAP